MMHKRRCAAGCKDKHGNEDSMVTAGRDDNTESNAVVDDVKIEVR